jgi:hypothetical protein
VTTINLTWDDEPHLRLRLFRHHSATHSDWRLVSHRRMDRPLAGLEYEIEGQFEGHYSTRAEAFRWVALHWDYVIERLMANKEATR